MAGAQNHPYHIVNPSIWPLIGADLGAGLFGGLVMWMHDKPYGSYLFFAGVLGVIFTMFSWWADVIREAHGGDHTPIVQLHLRYGMILFIASEVMFFVAWFWAYFNAALFPSGGRSRSAASGRPRASHVMDPFGWPLLNTLILLCSGTTVTWAHHALIHGDRKGLINGLWVTIGLGLLFTAIQAYEYAHAPFGFRRQYLYVGLLHGDRLPRLPRHHRHDLPDRLPGARLQGPFHAASSISASRRPPGTGISSTSSGCSCSCASTSGAAGAPNITDARSRRQARAAEPGTLELALQRGPPPHAAHG